jgi:hypothetical protein
MPKLDGNFLTLLLECLSAKLAKQRFVMRVNSTLLAVFPKFSKASATLAKLPRPT